MLREPPVFIIRLISSAVETHLCLSPGEARAIPIVSDADSVARFNDRSTVCLYV